MESAGAGRPQTHIWRIAGFAVALAVATATAAIFGLENAGARLRERTAALSREIAARIVPRPVVPGVLPPGADRPDPETSALTLYTAASRRLDPPTLEELSTALEDSLRPDPELLARVLSIHADVVNDLLVAAKQPLGGSRQDPVSIAEVDVFEHLHLGELLRAAALAAESGEQAARRVEIWATAFQHARDLADHSSLLMAMVGSSLAAQHTETMAASLAEAPLPASEARALAAFLEELADAWPEPGGAFLREAEWMGSIQHQPELLDLPRIATWRHGFSWTLTLAASLDYSLGAARIVDPAIGRSWNQLQSELRDYEATHTPVRVLGFQRAGSMLGEMLEGIAQVRLAIGVLRLHAGDPLGTLESPFGGTVFFAPADAPLPRRLACPDPRQPAPIHLGLPEDLKLPGLEPR